MKDKSEKKYQGGKKIMLNIPVCNIKEECYYKRMDPDKIIEEKYRKVTTDTSGVEIRRKLFVKGDTTEKEYEYKYLKEDGSVYDGEKITQIIKAEDGSMIPIDKERYAEFIEFVSDADNNIEQYIVEDIYNVYAYEENSRLYDLANKLLTEKMVAKFKFNPNGFMTGLGFMRPITTEDGECGLLLAYCRVKYGNHIQTLKKTITPSIKKNKVEFIE